MKKRKILTAIYFVLMVTILAPYMPTNAAEELQATELESDVIMDFENVKETLKSIRLQGVNKAQFCEDKAYVTEGETCLRLCPELEPLEEGSYYSDSLVVFYPKQNTYSNVEYICLDVYNPTDVSRKVMWGFDSTEKEFVVEPGENTLWLYVDRATLQYAHKGVVTDFWFRIEGGSSEMGAFDLYIDNFRCYYAVTEYEEYSNDFSQEVWYTFEQEAELYNLIYQGTRRSHFSQPLYSINRDIRYIKSGNGSLKVDFRNMSNGEPDTRMFRIKSNQVGDLNQYLDNLENYYMGFSLYNANDYEISYRVTVFSNYNNETMSIDTTIPANSWSDESFVLPLKDLRDKFTGTGLDIMTVVFACDGISEEGTVYLDSLGIYSYE